MQPNRHCTMGGERYFAVCWDRSMGWVVLLYSLLEISVNTSGVTCSEWESALRNFGKRCTVWGQRDEKIPENNICESNHWSSLFLSLTTGSAPVCPGNGNRTGC